MDNVDILILGAGPAGITAAYELNRANKKTLIIEKECRIGGLAKTLKYIEDNLTFKTDIGPHRFFSKNKYLYDLIGELLGEKWIIIPRKTRQYINGKFYDYPINVKQALKNLGVFKSFKIFVSYFSAFLKYRIFKRKISNFEDYIVANFGKVLGEMNMLNYTSKVWGLDCKKIHPDWAIQRIKGLDIISSLLNSLKIGNENSPKTLIDHFYYPSDGTGLIYETMARSITKERSKIITNSYPLKIKHSNGRISAVDIKIQNKKKKLSPKILIESIPITDFIKLLSPPPPEDILNAANNLKWRSQVYIFVTLNKNSVTKDNWIYFPEKDIPFGRVSEPKNFIEQMSPKKKTSMFFEFFVTEGDNIWEMADKEIFEMVLEHSEKLGFFTRDEVRNYYLIKKKNVYPVYDLYYSKHLKILIDYMNSFKNLYFIGRPGRFKYNNQDHSMEMGIIAAKNIINNKRFSIDNIGSELEYFENGKIN